MKLLLILTLLLFPVLDAEESTYYSKVVILEEIVIKPENYEQVILETLWKHGVSVDLSYIILAQAKHESANFTSKIFEEGWNCFGLKQAKRRKTTALGTKRNHAYYESVEMSTLDYLYYMEARRIPFHEKSIKKYVDLLKSKRYFEDSVHLYYNNVRKHKVKLDS